MKFNVKFDLTKGKKTERKFEVVDLVDLISQSQPFINEKVKKALIEKYPGTEIFVLKITKTTTALSESP